MRTALLGSALAAVIGCSHRTGDLTVLSTRTLSTALEKAPRRVEGGSCAHWIAPLLFFRINFGERDFKEAVDDALDVFPPDQYDALVDVVTRERNLWALLYGQSCMIVEGTPARLGPRISLTSEPLKVKVTPTVETPKPTPPPEPAVPAPPPPTQAPPPPPPPPKQP